MLHIRRNKKRHVDFTCLYYIRGGGFIMNLIKINNVIEKITSVLWCLSIGLSIENLLLDNPSTKSALISVVIIVYGCCYLWSSYDKKHKEDNILELTLAMKDLKITSLEQFVKAQELVIKDYEKQVEKE